LYKIDVMLILLSPAKNLDFSLPPAPLPRTQPRLHAHAAKIAKAAAKLTRADLMRLMGISEKLAELNVSRFRAFKASPMPEEAKQAALAFNGDVYLGLSAKTLSLEDFEWAQDRVRILSGLYGLLRPLDAIQPYRLEMGVKFAPGNGMDLYDYWKKIITPALNADLDALKGPRVVLNLASDEYASAVDRKSLTARVVTPVFRDEKDGVARSVFLYVKRARGEMARWIIENRINDIDAAQRFSGGGYRLNPAQSSEDSWVFIRPQPKSITAGRKSA
jgi:cytoplasmic iron level regulating protein YaaA (DUF328/UPF0246 family)